MANRNREKKKQSRIDLVVLVALVVVLSIEVLVTFGANFSLYDSIRPAKINFFLITDSTCKDCAGMDAIASAIESSNHTQLVQKKTIDFSSSEARQLVDKYSIKSVPAIVITGEVNKTNVQYLWRNLKSSFPVLGVLVIESDPPYVDTSTNQIKGRVSITNIVDSNCQNCSSFVSFVNSLKQSGVFVSDEKTFEYTAAEAKSLISTQNIQRVPAIAMSDDILAYSQIAQYLNSINATDIGGIITLTAQPPYLDLKTGTIKGFVDMIELTDNSCSSCYNVSIHLSILQGYGLSAINITNYDVSSADGKAIIQKYNITKVPTFVLSPEASLYSALNKIWPQVGFISKDGYYVFTATEVMKQYGAYKDLSTGKTI